MEPPSPDGKGIWLDIQANFFLSEKRPWYKQKDVIWTSNGDEKVGMMSVMSVWKEKTIFILFSQLAMNSNQPIKRYF